MHIVSENSAFTQQQTDLIWRMLSDKHIPVNQVCASVGGLGLVFFGGGFFILFGGVVVNVK